MKRQTGLLAIVTGSLFAGPIAATAEELSIYNWADYFGETTVSDYEAETGTDVTLDYFDSNEVLETKLLTGASGYDVVFPAASNAQREFQAGALHPIDPSRLSNYGNLNPDILTSLDAIPGGRELGVPYTWGTIGLAYNVAMIEERLGTDTITSWDVLFDPEIAGKLADCGIAVLDSPIEMVSVALNYLGADPYSNDREDLDKVRDLYTAVSPSIRYFHNQKASTDLPSGDVCLSVMYSGDAGIAQARAMEAESGVDILYSIPTEGTLMWIDLMAIPVDAKRVDDAYRFLDYMLRPEVIADVSNYVYFANANKAADAFVDEAILTDPGIYPDEATLGRLFPDLSVGAKTLRNRNRLWTSVKSGT
ncbi:Spermidine-binding periplasmic protein SpuE [Aliiroseovarius pelagivivens]|uniref:Putrescine-binding periplasmic protein n=1 Tax=Aliiroseovarius pelagivivens TaxID=1639690 RepID=A0A2R8AJQ0_9RHOB|nr:polyamine ABC transporter substrate-binding protein [Aliiroseovarius pelagivivens]SPF76119.1 Spermidine-binding periplasmic protein SpuE [Aliiroseovarius pelagivivens]